ncbi:serine/threonine protein kinase [Microbacterium laevaniformans]|uniref:non-specific serine/threonine protein kinase n=1 Tax=Microbacterium laevaniformans TaxID=36807 RepID=A0A4S2CXI8_9MICO|nr:serine/threonine-protein kinase [Microbacterium laevaniformans]TGY33281.1 serine/threonine protein kinase [Microbacterium laevaniformans]
MPQPPLPFTDAELADAFPGRQLAVPPLGRGSFKVAYFADDTTQSVVKVLTDPLPSDVDGTEVDPSLLPERFAREVRAMQLADSPHLVKILVEPRAVQIGANRYVAYEEPFYGGGTLADRLRNGAMTEAEAGDVIVALLRAVRELWRNDIVHRDIKPGNIVFSADGTPVLIDPGISLHVGLDDLTDSSHISPMTPGYSAPEQHEARRYARIDFRTDHFLVGVVGYFALTGKHPILEAGMDRNEYIVKLLSFDRIDVSALLCSAELRLVLGRLLAPKPNRRFRTTAEPLEILGVT